MRKFALLWTICMILAFQMGPITNAQADVLGRLTQVEGRADILRGGQLPATPVKVDDGVQTGDVLRTKSLSKAQITFIDNSTLTVSPESRVGIEAYMFDSAQNKRNAVIQLFQGLAHVVVNQVFKAAEPDFVVKTHTAVMGVRGTDFGIRLHPNSSTILNFEGVLQVGNIFPEVGQLSRRALKIAYSFGPPGSSNSVLLRNMQGTSVGRGMPPTLPFTITPEDQKSFMNQMAGGLTSRKSGGDSGGGEGGAGGGGEGGLAHTFVADQGTAGTGTGTPTPGSFLSDSMNNYANLQGGATIANTSSPQQFQPVTGTNPNPVIQESIYSYTINKNFTTTYTMDTGPPSNSGMQGAFTGSLALTNSIVAYSVTAAESNPPGGFNKDFTKDTKGTTPTINWNLSGTVSGPAGTTGTVVATGVSSEGTKFVIPLTVTLTQNNKVTFPTGTITAPITGGNSTVINPSNPGKDYNQKNKEGGDAKKASDGTATVTYTKTPKP